LKSQAHELQAADGAIAGYRKQIEDLTRTLKEGPKPILDWQSGPHQPLPEVFPGHDRLPPFRQVAQLLAGEDGWNARHATDALHWFERYLQDDVWNRHLTIDAARLQRDGAGRLFALVEQYAGKEE
jgi:hypothetical protein